MSNKVYSSIQCSFCNIPYEKYKNAILRCKRCKVVVFPQAKQVQYEEKYFLDEYKNQYGISYFEDKQNLQKKMKWRLNQFFNTTDIHNTFAQENITLLEIGSAAGFFLELSQTYNMQAEGWEYSAFMSEYAKKQKLQSVTGDFFSIYQKEKPVSKYHIIAAFYCIEHIQEQDKLWSALSSMLKKNGFLLLSIPSYFGPTFYFSFSKWLQTHPIDHFVDYSPSSIKKVASLFGFRFVKAFPEGIHPNRFPFGDKPFLQPVYKFLQKFMCFSDTIFVILQKK